MTARRALLGVLAVLTTAVLAIVTEVIVAQVGWSLSNESKLPGMSFGVDIVSLIRNRLLTPSALIAAAVIFLLASFVIRPRSIS